jgi:4'-phosphopantetheinyl transferase EntD
MGIDAEPHAHLSRRVLGAIARPDERVELAQLMRAAPAVCWDRLLFSAKESVYKAWFPLTRRWLDFEDVTLAFDPQRQAFNAELHVTPPLIDGVALTEMEGRFAIHDGLLLTAIVLPRKPCVRASPSSRCGAM